MNGKKTLFWKFQWWYVCLCISQQSTEQLVELFLFNGHPPTYTEQFSLFFYYNYGFHIENYDVQFPA